MSNQIKTIIKWTPIGHYNNYNVQLESYVKAIDKKNIDEIKILTKKDNSFTNKRDVVYEMYDEELLTPKRFEFIVKNCIIYLNISSSFSKRIIKEDNFEILNILFENYKFFNNKFIIYILTIHYKNKIPISNSDLNQIISKYKHSKVNSIPYNSYIRYLFDACEKGNEYVLKYLVEHEADIDEKDKYGSTPLHYVCESGNENIFKYLVEHGANIYKENNFGETPLHFACFGGNEFFFKYLVEHGADIYEQERSGKTPLHYACKSGNKNIIKYLVLHGAVIYNILYTGKKIFKKMLHCTENILINILIYSFGIPYWVCQRGNKFIIKYSVLQGAAIYNNILYTGKKIFKKMLHCT